ncbi:hypothetical protein XSR1_190064 [Xenorhabdus szentirmaii DSM 16338]|uniref:Uncharacterized protein n=1 Tax=Xenorhabdus szentirmaii DSM 16338 TaxID=1427518 RepID=W1IUG1_9GAMM|nr:hypothetical protein XSR1_190064 [Xenorhabdus szentirmaii DSM 16338]
MEHKRPHPRQKYYLITDSPRDSSVDQNKKIYAVDYQDYWQECIRFFHYSAGLRRRWILSLRSGSSVTNEIIISHRNLQWLIKESFMNSWDQGCDFL